MAKNTTGTPRREDGSAAGADAAPIVIKKYANRRLYNTESSTYITLDHLARLIREGRDFKVIDARSEEDITHNVLTQIIMDEESRGNAMLPAGFLRQLISLYGDSMQSMVPAYLEASMTSFRRNQTRMSETMKGALERSGPFGEIAKRNLEMFEAATAAFVPPPRDKGGEPPRPKRGGDEDAPRTEDELQAVKAQLAELQAKLDRLSG